MLNFSQATEQANVGSLAISLLSGVIATQVMPLDIQERFASFSGDRNPMHVDRLAARRTQPGDIIAHGCYMLLSALDSLATSGSIVSEIGRIKVKFLKWVYMGDE